MQRKIVAILLCFMCITFCNGCGAEQGKMQVVVSEEQLQSIENVSTEDVSAEKLSIEEVSIEDLPIENLPTEDVSDTEEKSEVQSSIQSEVQSIQEEIAEIEVKSCEYENAVWKSMGQQEMNYITAQWYQLWDDELNSLWSRLSDELDAETKEKLLTEQRAWIKRKEKNVVGAGAAAFRGSLQPQLENSTAKDMTRSRVYILADYLADVRNEAFTIPLEIQENIDIVDPDLNDVFEKFEGQWIFDLERGACVGIEKTEMCSYGVEGSNWTVWVTGGSTISDLDVYGYTEKNIIFKVAHDDYDAYYELSYNSANSMKFAYGTSLDAMDDVIVFD